MEELGRQSEQSGYTTDEPLLCFAKIHIHCFHCAAPSNPIKKKKIKASQVGKIQILPEKASVNSRTVHDDRVFLVIACV